MTIGRIYPKEIRLIIIDAPWLKLKNSTSSPKKIRDPIARWQARRQCLDTGCQAGQNFSGWTGADTSTSYCRGEQQQDRRTTWPLFEGDSCRTWCLWQEEEMWSTEEAISAEGTDRFKRHGLDSNAMVSTNQVRANLSTPASRMKVWRSIKRNKRNNIIFRCRLWFASRLTDAHKAARL